MRFVAFVSVVVLLLAASARGQESPRGVLVTLGSRADCNPAERLLAAAAPTRRVPEYMNALKLIFDINKPTPEEKAKWRKLSYDPHGMRPDDVRSIRVKYQNVLDGTKRLAPPPTECRSIHDLAVRSFTKMLRILDLSEEMITRNDPSHVDEVRQLVSEVQIEAVEFDGKVVAIRNKYRLGPP